MNQGSEFVTQQEPTPAFQDQGSRIIPPKKVLRRFVHTKIPKLTVSLPLSLIPQKPEKKPIDYCLARCMWRII
ncbi:MAG: hypothetical protein JRF24_11195 [Deltaproteobacteria bacterium]|nr:hypothetical protein [Deltaproteobacteria bacterium]